MPEQSTNQQASNPQFTRAQIDNTVANLEEDLKRWGREENLRMHLNACSEAMDNLWEQMAEQNTRALEAQAAYFADPNPERNHAALLDFQIASKELIPLQIAYRLASKTQRALRLEWNVFCDGDAQARREDLLAKLEYVRGLTPAPASDAPTHEEVQRAREIHRAGRIGSTDEFWGRLTLESQQDYIAQARAQIQAESDAPGWAPRDAFPGHGFTHSCNNCGFMTYASHAGETCVVIGCDGVYEEGVDTESKSRWSQEEIDLAQMLYRSGRPSVPRWRDVIDEVKAEYLTKARVQIESEKTNG